ncbi:uncharacterized protein LOC143474521 [Brachyhypopomus gauderio]|uniref:uncharacterized protein LOC143474521 n=1 Tax=Brachyhypopomus gauderio TaxID=698409 RepID=UPI004041BD49
MEADSKEISSLNLFGLLDSESSVLQAELKEETLIFQSSVVQSSSQTAAEELEAVMGRTTLVRQHCADRTRVKPRIVMLSLAQSGLAQDVSPILSADPPWPQIFSGETVKLTCLIRGWRVSWKYHWDTNGQTVHSSDLNSYIIRDLKEQSHTYKCYGRSDYGGSQWSNEVTLTVIGVVSEAPVSVLRHLSSLLAASPYVLLSFILAVKYYRAQTTLDENRLYEITEAETSA